MRFSRHQTGFTFVELMVTLAVLAIIATAALANMRSFIVNANLRGCVSSLQTDAMNARTEAIRLQRNVEVRPITGTNWLAGWQVTVMRLDGVTVDEVLLSRSSVCEDAGATVQNLQLRVDTIQGSTIRYDASGFTRDGGGAFMAGCLRVDAPYTTRSSAVIFGSTGRPRIWRGAVGDGECVA